MDKPPLWPADCASLVFWCITQIDTQKLMCASGSHCKPGFSPSVSVCCFRRNRSPFHLEVPPEFAPKALVDMVTSLGCSYGVWQQY